MANPGWPPAPGDTGKDAPTESYVNRPIYPDEAMAVRLDKSKHVQTPPGAAAAAASRVSERQSGTAGCSSARPLTAQGCVSGSGPALRSRHHVDANPRLPSMHRMHT